MATARKLPSGSWRIRVYSHTDAKGKKVYKSFTAPTKAKAQKAAALWEDDRAYQPENIAVGEAVERYIASKSTALSPATIRGYRAMQKTLIDRLKPVRLRSLTSEIVQLWISDMSDKKPKTVKNAYGLLTAVLAMFAPDSKIEVALPVIPKRKYHIPTDTDVEKLLRHCREKKMTDLWIALMLARYYGLRRGEICALTSADFESGVLWITKDTVQDSDGRWLTKDTPKTSESHRSLIIADPLLSVLREISGPYVLCTPSSLSNRLYRAQKTCQVQRFGIHALRHSFASHAALKGVPDLYTAKIGGWNPNSPVLKTVYQNEISGELAKQMAYLNEAIPKDV